MTNEIRVGDVVAVTARVTALRGDGTYAIEPVGFDYELTGYDEWDASKHEDVLKDLGFYTVDEPRLVQHGWVRGDEKFSGDGERYVYHDNLGEGVHLLNRPGTKQHLTGAWLTMTTEQVAALRDEPPE